jgi:hypothetical protein
MQGRQFLDTPVQRRTRDVVAAILVTDDGATTEAYRRKASRLREVARTANNAAVGRQILQLARQFDEFADKFTQS